MFIFVYRCGTGSSWLSKQTSLQTAEGINRHRGGWGDFLQKKFFWGGMDFHLKVINVFLQNLFFGGEGFLPKSYKCISIKSDTFIHRFRVPSAIKLEDCMYYCTSIHTVDPMWTQLVAFTGDRTRGQS